jgi:glycosyltransferase involved in cell wall biosynthesis
VRVLTVGNLYPPNHLGGYELMWQAAVQELRRRGHEVRVLATPELRWYWRSHRWPRRLRLAAPWIERHNRRVFAAAAAPADVVSFWSMGGLSMSLVEHRPSLAVVMDDWLLYGPRVDPAWRRDGPPAVDRALFISRFVRERSGVDGEIVHAGYDQDVFGVQPEHEAWGGRLYLPGRLDRRKGHLVALAALPEDATLLISGVGDEAYGASLRARADGRVSFSTTRDRAVIAAEYAACDAVLFPVEWDEPWGLVPLEAMAVGRPVIATGTGGSAEYLRDGENCLLVPRGDAAALRAAIGRLAGDPALRARLRAGGLATAAEHTLARFVARVADEHEAHAAQAAASASHGPYASRP